MAAVAKRQDPVAKSQLFVVSIFLNAGKFKLFGIPVSFIN